MSFSTDSEWSRLFVLGIWPVLSVIAWPLILNEVTGAAPVPEWVIVVGYVDSLSS